MKIKIIKTRGCVDTILAEGCTNIAIDCYADGNLRVMQSGANAWKELYRAKYSSKAYARKKAILLLPIYVKDMISW